ncbi:MAG TPA: MraY family glycosyltransferase [Acidimicrobiales bacterium]|nr:MraY family glycosyltransferase [Acidimicrobiales bacterium]
MVAGVAAAVTWAATFAVRRLAWRYSMVVVPDERRVHEQATPTLGGAAMYLGVLVAVATASQLPALAPVFRGSSEPIGLVVAATVIFAVGSFDDLREMSPPAKVSGQVLAGTVLYFAGISMLFFKVPLLGTTLSLSPDLVAVMTVMWVVGMANAVNLVDGLDGLAAGIVAIASAAFYLYSTQLVHTGAVTPENSGPLIAAVVFGCCVGFLPHNVHPARIFMGDAGAMLLGLMMAASTMSVVGQSGSGYSGRTYFFYAPIFIPFFILGIPILDTAFAIVRRAGRRSGVATADKNHLHHRLMRLGHGQTRAVLILWAWTALLSGLVLVPALTGSGTAFIPAAVAGLGVALYTLFAPRGRAAREQAEADLHAPERVP